MSRWIALTALVVLASSAPALAQPVTESRWEKGRRLYELGKYKEAIVEWEAAYEAERKPTYLYNLAQAYRFLDEYDRSIQLYRHYLDVRPDDPDREKIEATIEELKRDKAAKQVALQAAADKAAADKVVADKAAADRAAADRAAAELAARNAALAGENKHLRIALDVGVSIIRLDGLENDARSPSLGGRIGVSWIKRLGSFTLDLGGSWQLTTIPYTEMRADGDRQVSVFFTQLHATAALTHRIAGPFWARAGIGLGVSAFGNLRLGNPVIENRAASTDIRQGCARLDTLVGYQFSPTLDFVLGVAATSISSTNEDLDPKLDRIVTLEGGWIGVYIKI